MAESKPTNSPGWFAEVIPLAIGVLILVMAAGCGTGSSSRPVAELAPTPLQAIPAMVSPAPRPQESQVPAATLPRPAVTLPLPNLPTRAAMPPPATIAAPGAEEIARGPRLTIETTEFDFGQVPATGILEHVFVFTNTGESDLVIEQIVSTWGCTAALVSAKEIAPGETGEIRATLDPSGHNWAGQRVSLQFHIHSNDLANPWLRVVLRADLQE